MVGLAVPLAREWESVRKLALPIAGALVVGSAVALVSTIVLAHALGATPATLLSLAPEPVEGLAAVLHLAAPLGGAHGDAGRRVARRLHTTATVMVVAITAMESQIGIL